MTTDASAFFATVDRSAFDISPYCVRVEKPWGYELHLSPPSQPYVMKILGIMQGKRLSLQVHDQKTETWTVVSGRAGVILEDADGELVEIELQPGVGYTSQIGQRHRLFGITDCQVAEASTPEIGTTFRLEDDFKREHETEEVRGRPGRV